MGTTTFSGPVKSNNGFQGNLTGGVTGNVVGSVKLPAYTVASAPAATDLTGTLIYVSNGLAGAPCVAVSNGTNWISPAGTTIAAS